MKPTSSPWGKIQTCKELIPEMWHITTASHGGIYCEPERNKKIPQYLQDAANYTPEGWYEEDCEWCIPFVVFHDELIATGEHSPTELSTLKNWYPTAYEAWTGTILQPGESMVKDEREWKRRHEHDLQVICAQGDSSFCLVPAGKTLVTCTIGGQRGKGVREYHFLIDKEEYTGGRFLVNPWLHPQR